VVLNPSPEQTLLELRERLSHVRGPIRYVDISGKFKPHVVGAEAPAPPGDQPPPTSAAGLAAPATGDLDVNMPGSITPEWLRFDDLVDPNQMSAAPSPADLRRPDPVTPVDVPPSPKREFPAAAVQEIQRQRSAAGEPPLQHPRVEVAEGSVVPPEVNPVMIPGPESDAELWADVYLLKDSPEDVFLVRKGSNTIVMSRMSPNERVFFEEAKDKALLKYINRTAWKSFKTAQVRAGTSCPMLYLKPPTPRQHIQCAGCDSMGPTNHCTRCGDMYCERCVNPVGVCFMCAGAYPQDDEVLEMLKSGFGDIRAPRGWCGKASVEMPAVGFLHHPLERGAFLSLQGEYKSHEGRFEMGVHVDDVVGGGEQVAVVAVQGLTSQPKGALPSGRRLRELTEQSEFGKLRYGGTQWLMGTLMSTSPDCETFTLTLPDYIKMVKPITILKERRVRQEEPCDSSETSSYRALSGAMQWPATPAMLYASASQSIAQGNWRDLRAKDLVEANKLVRITKETEHLRLRFCQLCSLPDLRWGEYFGAAWMVRRNQDSQAGHLISAIPDAAMVSGEAISLVVGDWVSRKIPRVSGSSLSAESQSDITAVDSLEFVKLCWTVLLWPTFPLKEEGAASIAGRSPVITNAKGLFDAAANMSASHGLTVPTGRLGRAASVAARAVGALMMSATVAGATFPEPNVETQVVEVHEVDWTFVLSVAVATAIFSAVWLTVKIMNHVQVSRDVGIQTEKVMQFEVASQAPTTYTWLRNSPPPRFCPLAEKSWG